MVLRVFILIFIFYSTLFSAGFDSSKKQRFLSPQEAFKVTITQEKQDIFIDVQLEKDIYIYADTLVISSKNDALVTRLDLELPEIANYMDEKVYKESFRVKASKEQVDNTDTLIVSFEGCSSQGICYEPQSYTFTLEGDKTFLEKIDALSDEVNISKIENVLRSESGLFILFIFFIFGFLLSLTPCIFPMIPILSSILVSQAKKDDTPSKTKGFFISLIYVISMALTYTVVGVVAGLLGADIQAAMQNPIVIILFAALFVALALSLFGYYEIALPAKWQSKISNANNKAYSKGVLGIAIMGVFSALIVGPCVAPPLGGAVLFISHTGDAFLGGAALFVMSMGMGVPLLLVGLGAGKIMPKPGAWMTRVTRIFGVIMLALAIWMLSRILPSSIILILWAILFCGSAFFMGLFDNTLKGTKLIVRFFAFIFALYGVSLFVGALSGASSMFHPFENFGKEAKMQEGSIVQDTHYDLETLLETIRKSDTPVIVYFTKESCVSCKELKVFTFSDKDVMEALKKYKFITVDVTKNLESDKEILRHFGIFGTPNILFFDKNGNLKEDQIIVGFIKADRFLEYLRP
ncbi:MAG: protein-disulfide reductase DsbD [Campylobacterales bacterium]|nr:protein-disulfide reductase DsbD [Campylobacterales bacterium]